MNNWYAFLDLIDVNTPETKEVNLVRQTDEGDLPYGFDEEMVMKKVEELGLPVFVRTDAASDKHRMEKASKISSEEEIVEHINEVIFHNASNMLPMNSLYFREWLDLKHRFKAFTGTPIAQELRFFIHNGQILDYHFYWVKDSIKFRGSEKVEDWQDKWARTKDEALDHSDKAIFQAETVAEKMRGQGFWSVDFARAEDGTWYAIDMARGEVSWHPEKKNGITTVSDYEDLYL